MKHITFRLAIIALTFFIGVTAATLWLVKYPGLVKYRKRCFDSYVPIGSFTQRESAWITEFYSSMQETPLSCLDENIEIYRLLYIPSFETPASIRVWRSGREKFIEIRQLASVGLPQGGAKDMKETISRPLNDEEWSKFCGLLEKSDFWSMPAKNGEAGLDGATFLLEGNKDGKYHVVARWSPKDYNFLDACAYLLEISGRTTKE